MLTYAMFFTKLRIFLWEPCFAVQEPLLRANFKTVPFSDRIAYQEPNALSVY